MAELQETREEQETRWATQRAAHLKELYDSQAADRRHTVRKVIVAMVVIIVGVVTAAMLL